MNSEICKFILGGMQNRQLKFLNISWNNLSGDCVPDLVRILEENHWLTKLAVQHNRFGEGDLTSFAEVLAQHENLEYLDISHHYIGNTQFVKIYNAIQGPISMLKQFNCRKNRVGGRKLT